MKAGFLVCPVAAAAVAAIRVRYRSSVFAIFAAFILTAFFTPAADAEDYGAAHTCWHGFNNGVDVYSGVFAPSRR